MKTGYFEVDIRPLQISEFSQAGTVHCSSDVILHYKPMKELHHRKCKHTTLGDSQLSETSLPKSPSSDITSSDITENWNSVQIDDFVRKLGFLEEESLEKPVRIFQQLNQVLFIHT